MSPETDLAPLTRRLQAMGINGLAAALLEHAGPLAFLGAPFLHVLAPAGRLLEAEPTVTALAQVLEDPTRTAAYARLLTEDKAT